MSWIAFFGALESGFIYAIMALGVLLSFRILDFPDLTADGSFPLGGAVAGVAIMAGVNPWVACIFAVLAGAIAGLLTAWLHVKLGVLHLLAGILMMTALYTVNLRIMNAPNLSLLGQETIFSSLMTLDNGTWLKVTVVGIIALVVKFALDLFFATEFGLAMRATGSNPNMAQASGVNTGSVVLLGMAMSNGLIGLSGALFVQTQGFVDVSMGIGTIIIGLAAVIIGETVMSVKKIVWVTWSVLVGAVIYKLLIQLALSSAILKGLGFKSQDLNFLTALLVVLVLLLPKIKYKIHRSGN